MSYQLPPNLLRLFQARPTLTFFPTSKRDKDPRQEVKKTVRPLQGIAAYVERVRQEAADAGQATEGDEANDGKDEHGQALTHTAQTKREIAREAEREKTQAEKSQQRAAYDPQQDPEAQGDPFTTLFISRLDYSITEADLRREFEMYGPIARIRVVMDKKGKSRGYAFIAYEHERDMRAAYKDAEGIKIKGRRAMVDVERGRTVKDWKPMRLGGGLGGASRKKKEPVAAGATQDALHFGGGQDFSAGGASGFRGGFGGGARGGGGRGGFRGGFGAAGGGRFGGPPAMGGGSGGGGFRGPSSGPPMGYSSGPPGGGGGGYGRYDGPPPAKRGRF